MWVQWQELSRGFYNVSGDFVGFWTAGELALEGHAADAYREMPHFFKQLALHGDPSRLYLAFFYPPFFLLLCAGFALLGFFTALCVWLIQPAPATPPRSGHCWPKIWGKARASGFCSSAIRPSW